MDNTRESKKKTNKLWDIDEIKRGDKIAIYCEHENCGNYLSMIVLDGSTGQFHHLKHGRFDFRNQVWRCKKHTK